MAGSKQAVLDRFLDAYNAGDLDRLDELVTADYVHHNCADELDLAQFKQGARWIRAGLPDFRVEVEDLIEDGDKVAMRFVGRGTHSGSLAGEAPTSKPVAMHGVMIYRFREGLIAEDWEAMDEGQLFKQISP
jgi:predicted ester cyclase